MALYAPKADKIKHRYTGTRMDDRIGWVVKGSFNSEKSKIELLDPSENSLFIEKEDVVRICEYATNKLLIHVTDKDLLLVDNFQVL